MPACCVVYTTDNNYMFPTLVSAMQARGNSSPDKADVIIFCVGLDSGTQRLFAPICEREGIGLIPVNEEAVEGQSAMLARLFLNRYVPAGYSQYLYLDSDVHLLDSIDPLVEAYVPEGHFLAANDPMTFLLADDTGQSRDLSKHLQSLGFSREQAFQYFNSGVLRINRNGWNEIGLNAWETFRREGNSNRFPDQDALNLAGIGKRLPMSLAWNFPVFMRNSCLHKEIEPRILHFMSSPKPWHGAFPPWTRESCRPYSEAVTTYPSLSGFHEGMSFQKRMKYQLQQRGKKLLEAITWSFGERRGRIIQYEASCTL